MKKLMAIAMIAAFLTFGGAVAHADEMLYGWIIEIYEICLYESCTDDIPDQPCDLEIRFLTENLQRYELSVTACGTQINLALLKAFNFGEIVEACLRFRFVTITDCDFDCLSVEFEIVWICFGDFEFNLP